MGLFTEIALILPSPKGRGFSDNEYLLYRQNRRFFNLRERNVIRMGTEVFIQLIGSLGFPIAVAIWFMVKGSKDTERMCECLRDLKEAISILQEKIDR